MNPNSNIINFSTKIKNVSINFFSTPNFFIDNIFTDELANLINTNWPKNNFKNEVKGNYILPIYKANYSSLDNSNFWANFNENIWPTLMASIAQKFELFGNHIYGDDYKKFISLDHPLTLMQADRDFIGHDMHTHFYHAPHWAFTVLIYIDNEDLLSEGTTLHALQPEIGNKNFSSSCISSELNRAAEISFDTFRWLDSNKPDRKYLDLNISYKFNRLFTFIDGPLALHSVKKYTTIEDKVRSIHNNPKLARRRILRSHIKVHHEPFYKMLSKEYGIKIDPTVFMKLMSFDPILNINEEKFKSNYLFNIYFDLVKKHSEFEKIFNNMNLNCNLKLQATSISSSSFIQKLKNNFINKNRKIYYEDFIFNFKKFIP